VADKSNNGMTIIETPKGEVRINSNTVRTYLVSGKGKPSDQEIMMFLSLCKYQGLNPFLREVYLIKYADNAPAAMVTGKEAFLKRASRNAKYEGHETGISDDGKIAWAQVHVKGYKVPIKSEVDYDEYVGLKDGKPNKMWASKGRTMLKKVALVQALREAFPEDLGGMYSQEEINTVDEPLSTTPVQETLPSPKGEPKKEKKELTQAHNTTKNRYWTGTAHQRDCFICERLFPR